MARKIILSGIYRISNIIDNRCYIGSAVDIHGRWDKHLSNLKKNEHHSIYLQRFYNKYSKNVLIFEIMELCKPIKEIMLPLEQEYLDEFKPEFNMCKIASSCLGYRHTDQAKQNMSDGRQKTPVAQYDLEGKFIASFKSLADMYRKTGFNITNINECAKGKTSKANGFMWKLYNGCNDNIEPYVHIKRKVSDKGRESLRIAANKPERLEILRKKVNQYNLEGVFIKTWESMTKAESSLNIKGIHSCTTGRYKTVGNFQWKYYEGNVNDISPVKSDKTTAIKIGLLDDNLKIIKLYDSIISAALELNLTPVSISRTCKGKIKSTKGYKFKYLNDTTNEQTNNYNTTEN